MLWLKRRKVKEFTDQPQYIKDHELSSLEDHYLFWDYLEIGKIKCCIFRRNKETNLSYPHYPASLLNYSFVYYFFRYYTPQTSRFRMMTFTFTFLSYNTYQNNLAVKKFPSYTIQECAVTLVYR